jgi:hypothetical protein
VGRGRVTGASTVTGGRLDCASAPENDATAIRPATAVTFRPERLSDFSLAEFIAAFERSDLGVFALFIHSPQTKIQSAHASFAMSARMWLSSEKNRVNANRSKPGLNLSSSKRF